MCEVLDPVWPRLASRACAQVLLAGLKCLAFSRRPSTWFCRHKHDSYSLSWLCAEFAVLWLSRFVTKQLTNRPNKPRWVESPCFTHYHHQPISCPPPPFSTRILRYVLSSSSSCYPATHHTPRFPLF